MDNKKADLIEKLEKVLRPSETLGQDFMDLLDREGYRFDRNRIRLTYGSGKLYLQFFKASKLATVWVKDLNKLTVQTLNFAARSGFEPKLVFCVKDILAGIDKNSLNNPPPDRVFGVFFEWVEHTDLKNNPNVVFDLLPDERITRIRETPKFQTCFKRYIPGNFNIQELSSLILVKNDLPKTPKEALRLFREKSFLKEEDSLLKR